MKKFHTYTNGDILKVQNLFAAVLTLYLINILKFNKNKATVFFHSFTVLAYTSPLLGSVLADGYIGKFWRVNFLFFL